MSTKLVFAAYQSQKTVKVRGSTRYFMRAGELIFRGKYVLMVMLLLKVNSP